MRSKGREGVRKVALIHPHITGLTYKSIKVGFESTKGSVTSSLCWETYEILLNIRKELPEDR